MKNKITKRVFCACIAATMMQCPPNVLAQELDINESFNNYVTNEQPSGVNVNAKAYCITEYEKENKGLLMYAGVSSSILSFDVPNLDDICISFEIQAKNNAPGGTLSIADSSGTEQQLMQFTAGGGAGAHNGYPISGFGTTNKVRYDIVYRPSKKNYDIYIKGKKVISEQRINSVVTKTAQVKFTFASETGEDGVIIDNVNIHGGTTPQKKYPEAEYNSAANEENEFTFGETIGQNVLVNVDFESGAPLSLSSNNNTLDVAEDEDGNKVLLFERTNTSDFHASATGLISESDSIVYDFKVKILDLNSTFSVTQKDSAGKFAYIGKLSKGGMFVFENGYAKQFAENRWYRITAVANYYSRNVKFYLDKKLVGETTIDSNFAVNGATPDIFRIHATHYASSVKASDTDPIKFMVDDFRVYEGNEIIDDFSQVKKSIDLTNKKTVYSSDAAYKAMLDGYQAVHVRDGVVFSNGEKSMLRNKPYINDATAMVPAAELAEKFGATVVEDNGNVTLNGKTITAETEGVKVNDGVIYVSIEKMAQYLEKSVTYIDAQYNSGCYVLGNTKMQIPSSEDECQKLNDYVFYLRPTTSQVKEAYASSPQNGQHPRIQATAADFERIRNEVETNTYKKRWSEKIIALAEQIITQEPVKYELRDGVRLLMVSRDVLERMYTLGMAYQLTKDTKYSDRAYLEMETVSGFSDWHPQHHLDPCEMMAGVAIGYDWMYEAFTEEQRHVIEEGMYNNGFYDAWLSYLSESSAMTNAATATNNHNIVCNGGTVVGALAMIDVYPDVCEYLIKNAVRGTDLMMWHWAPSGCWYEGAGYWEYTMQYTQKYVTSMQTALGTDFGMGSCEGLDKASEVELYMQSPLGIYSYSDAVLQNIYAPEMLWSSVEYGNKDVTKAVIRNTNGDFNNGEDLALALIYYDTSILPEYVDLDIDKYVPDQAVAALRNSWDDKEPTFVGIHAGETNLDHAHLDGGSFIFDALGVRWAKDLGMGDYNSEGYWDNTENGTRWKHFRLRAEAHNTLVINPSDKPDHKVYSNADMELVQSKPRGSIVKVDMTDLLRDDVTSATRGFFFTDNRQSLVIRDEINLKSQSDIYWFMITDADAQINGNSVILSQDGRMLQLDFLTNANAEVSFDTAQPLATSPHMSDDAKETSKRLAIKLNGSGNVTLTVKLSRYGEDFTPVTDYDMSIDSWNVPDGEIPTPPSLDAITVGGKEIKTNGKKNIEYNYVEGEITTVPSVSVNSELYDVNIVNAESLNDTTKIVVTDKNEPANKTVYNVIFKMIKKPIEFTGRTSLPVRDFEVSEIPQEENAPINLFDNDLNTRWSAEGYGQWALLDLGSVMRVDDIAMAFFAGDTRSTKVVISVSADGISYEEVFNGLSCGTTTDYEFFPVGGKDARYIKIGFNGNTAGASESWNSVTEIVVTQKN